MVETNKQKFNKKYGFEKNASHSIREIASKAGISYRNALKIVEKGRGAHKSNPQSVRRASDGKKVGGASLKGKMSATQWGIARLYSAVMGGPAAKVDKDLLK
jgi:hypothetical protein